MLLNSRFLNNNVTVSPMLLRSGTMELTFLICILLLVTGCSTKHYTDPLSPEEALKRFALNEDFEIEIFAAEPFVLDPVDLVFDEQGNAYVVEMPDYPYQPEEGKA